MIKQIVLSKKEMQQCDFNTSHEIGISENVLMERAALHVVNEILKRSIKKKILVVCGIGNNGGDGLAVTRILSEYSMEVDCVLIGSIEKCSDQTKKQIDILDKLHIPILRNFKEREYDIVIDALFGIGLSREIQGEYKDAVTYINQLPGFKISLDIPSGIHADNGKILGCAVKADETITFGFLKKGLCFYPGKEYAGIVKVVNIGISDKSFLDMKPNTFTCFSKAKDVLPHRIPWGNKGTFGKLLIVAGSVDMAGAAILCANAAYRMGVGMVKIVSPIENRCIIQESIPEALFLSYEKDSFQDKKWVERWNQSKEWADAYVIGCGLGQGEMAKKLVRDLLLYESKSLVIDADALNLISNDETLEKALCFSETQCVLTPHPGELSRLLKKPVSELKEDFFENVLLAAQKLKKIIVGKDAVTVVGSPTNENYINQSGNCGMATAGSGDVLAGIIGGLLVQKESPLDSAWKGVYLHGLSGDVSVKEKGKAAMMASDLIESLGKICIEEIEND